MKVSIITPSYNQGAFIGRTIESVRSQRANDFELEHLIFDGASNDQTVEVLKSFGPDIVWVSEPDRGQTHAVNKGLKASSGDVIGWLNSDDVYYPGAIAKIVSFFEEHADIDVVYGLADHIDLEDRPFEEYPTEAFDLERMKETCTICQPALFFRRRVFEKYGMLDEKLNYCMDYEFWLRLGKAGARFALIPHKLAGSRLYADNKTLGARVKVHHEINDMFRGLFGQVPDRWIANYAHAWVEKRLDRNRNPRSFILLLSTVTVFASLSWNRSLAPSMRHTIKQWVLGLTH